MTTRAHAEKDARILARARAAEARVEGLEAEVERLRDEVRDWKMGADAEAHEADRLRAEYVPEGHARIDGEVVRLERGFVRAWESFLGAPIAEFEPDEGGDYMRVVPLDSEEADR